MFWQFVKAVASHWLSLLGGAGVSVGLLVLSVFTDIGVPRWLFWYGAIAGSASAAFLAWKDERVAANNTRNELREVRDGRPDAVLDLLVDGRYLCLNVRNDGAQGAFRATLETTECVSILRPVPALWDQTLSHEPFEIASGQSARLRLASIEEDHRNQIDQETGEEDPWSYGWTVFHHRPPGHQGWFPGRTALANATHEWFTLRITVSSNPQLQGRVAVKRIRFVGHEAIDLDSEERRRPTVIVLEDQYE